MYKRPTWIVVLPDPIFCCSVAKKQLLMINNCVQMVLRKSVNKNDRQHKAGDVIQRSYMEQLVKEDQGYSFLKTMQKTKVMAMLRQLGPPTFFVTISAAETLWPELLVILTKVLDHKDIGETKALNLSANDKYRLIRSDPITCAQYFDNRFQLLLNHLRSEFSVFKDHPMIHHFYRVEFQQRGSPHVHMMVWNEGAPTVEQTSTKEVKRAACDFIDKFVTCDSELPGLDGLIAMQKYNHSKSCKKVVRGKTICRYNIPFLPMEETTIVYPKDRKDVAPDDRIQAQKKNGLTKETYMRMVELSLRKPAVMLKRRPKDCFVNNFDVLENVCLAKFFAYYRVTKKEMDMQLKDKVQLMLYVPWRDEKRELINIDHEAVHATFLATILANSKEFNRLKQQDLEVAVQRAEGNVVFDADERPFVAYNDFAVYDIDRPDDDLILCCVV
ncbi:unnamed protein product [Brassicogethes aeneus]|uniref:Helitron helicase-like domain-containing protein n=1 Tax=Brassicogethes aeneus TaxID=1431903 RepID=A0A9P0B6C8_BRAAE|nr:unnamed protein product [Brassicogethes aeneus]